MDPGASRGFVQIQLAGLKRIPITLIGWKPGATTP
jgi:hypothetical protein